MIKATIVIILPKYSYLLTRIVIKETRNSSGDEIAKRDLMI